MFTGIVQTQAKVISNNFQHSVMRLVLAVAPNYIAKLELGASIAINGCCFVCRLLKFSRQLSKP